MATTEDQYIEIISRCKELYINKMKDYGCAWRILRLESLTDQIFIKAQRIRGLQINKEQKISEGQEDEFIGIINYSIMALIQIELGVSDQPDLNDKQAIDYYNRHLKITYDLMLEKNHFYYHHLG